MLHRTEHAVCIIKHAGQEHLTYRDLRLNRAIKTQDAYRPYLKI